MPERRRPRPAGLLVLWVVLFAISVGLGYPTLRRYDPRDPRTNFDGTTALYHWLVTGDAQEGARGPSLVHFRYRLLVPLVARPFYLLGKGHVGTWDPGYFGFLMANAIFCGSTALLLFLVAEDARRDRMVALVAALLYLVSFAVPNFLLAGLVDSGEAFSVMALVWCLRHRRWWGLAVLAVVGAFAKETFVPFSAALAAGWLMTGWRGRPAAAIREAFGWGAFLALVGLAALTIGFSIGNGRVVFPWQFERSGAIYDVSLWQRAARLAHDVGLVYVFGWLGPLGALGLAWCPRPWVAGAFLAALAAIAIGVFNGEPGVTRSLFNILGPLLSLGSAATLARLLPDSAVERA